MPLVNVVMPDVEAVVIQYLASVLVAPSPVAGRVYDTIPPSPTYPLVTVGRIGGRPPVPRWLDRALLDVDGWGDTKGTARAACAEAWAALMDLDDGVGTEGGLLTFGSISCVVTAVGAVAGLQWLPDDETDRPRYTSTVAVSYHPGPAGD